MTGSYSWYFCLEATGNPKVSPGTMPSLNKSAYQYSDRDLIRSTTIYCGHVKSWVGVDYIPGNEHI